MLNLLSSKQHCSEHCRTGRTMQGQVCVPAVPTALSPAARVSLHVRGWQARKGLGKGRGARWMLFPAYHPLLLCKHVCLARSHTGLQDLELCTPLLHTGLLPGSLCTGITTVPQRHILRLRLPPARSHCLGCARLSWPAQCCLFPQPGPGVRSESHEISKKSGLLRLRAAYPLFIL